MDQQAAIERQTRTIMRKLQHELRTPLGQILGYGEMLEEELRDRGLIELVHDIERIRVAANSLLGVVEGVFFQGEPLDARLEPSTPGHVDATTQWGPGDLPGRILVVDDEASNRELLSRRLNNAGHVAVVAAGGPAALRLIEDGGVDLVLLDLMMPDMDGHQTLEAIRETHSLSELPVIMVTARVGGEDVVAALQCGANDYITKPSDFSVVLARVHTQLSLRAARLEIEALARKLEVRNAFLRRTFGRYLSDEVVTTLLEHDDGLDMTGERRRVSAVMVDVRGFTALTERLDPRDVVTILNAYLTKMSETIEEYGGLVDGFIGDGILALFGALAPRDDDAQRAVACAIAMQEAISAVNRSNHSRGLPAIEIGVGVASGDVVVGNIGSERRSKHTAIGSAINLAARIESFTGGGEVLIAPATYGDVVHLVDVDGVRDLQVKGFDQVIQARRVSGIRGAYAVSLRRDLETDAGKSDSHQPTVGHPTDLVREAPIPD
jgi:class 3 adenylate cyclase